MKTNNILLNIENLEVKINKKIILSNLNLNLSPGMTYALMGPNGAGKSTLARVLARDKNFNITKGSILYKNMNLLDLTTEKCSLNGIFISFQHPPELEGVLNLHFLKLIYNLQQKYHNLKELNTFEFLQHVKKHMDDLNIKHEFLYRYLNVGLSGGEQKKNEVLQMCLLNPDLIILDEIDSGLDIDSLKLIANKIYSLKHQKQTILIITHYPRILSYIKPNYVFLLNKGKIIKTGDYTLALNIEKNGYL